MASLSPVIAKLIQSDSTVSNIKLNSDINLSGNTVIGQYWTVRETANTIIFAFDGTDKFQVESTGNLTVTQDVTAYGTL